jgi:hypothetical protein
VAERRHDKGAHVALVELPCGQRQPPLEVEVLEPVVHELGERVVRGEGAWRGLEEAALGELLLQRPLGGGPARAGGLDEAGTAVPVPVAGAGADAAAGFGAEADLPVGADRQAWPSHRHHRPSGSGRPGPGSRCCSIQIRTSETANFRCLPKRKARGPFPLVRQS